MPVPTGLPLPNCTLQYGEWVAEVLAMKEEHPLAYPHHEDVIMPQWAIEVRLSWAGTHASCASAHLQHARAMLAQPTQPPTRT